MNGKGTKRKNQVIHNHSAVKVLSEEEMARRIAAIEANLNASTWKTLETGGEFKKNEKLDFISDHVLIVGCDVGSEKHFARAIDTRGRELSKKAFSFSNDEAGFRSARRWALEIAVRYDKDQIILGLEPTGHYWLCLADWMVRHKITVVQVNPYAVKQTKEVEDNSQKKDDRKDPKVIANLVKDGNYGMPYVPEGIYAELRNWSLLRDQLMEDSTRAVNRLHRLMKLYFPEYMEAFGDLDRVFTLTALKEAPLPEDIAAIGTEGLRKIWKAAGLRGAGYSRDDKIVACAGKSVGLKYGQESARYSIKSFVEEITTCREKLAEVEEELYREARNIPNAEKILKIEGIGDNTLAGILAQIGDISRFDDAKELQKMSGLGLVECSSGKHKGQTKISRRGRKRLRYWLFQGAKNTVVHSKEFKSLCEYYKTRPNNPLKKMQSLIAVASKLLRVIFVILKTGREYDSDKMMRDIRRTADQGGNVA